MAARDGRLDRLTYTKEVLEGLRLGRRACIQTHARPRVESDQYQLASKVMDAIDDMAESLTGDRQYFWTVSAQSPKLGKRRE